MKFTIPLPPVTKKNSQRIVTVKGRKVVLPSQSYVDYEQQAGWFLPRLNVVTVKESNPWFNGVLALVLISLACVVIYKTLGLQRKMSAVLQPVYRESDV